jgi:Profilin
MAWQPYVTELMKNGNLEHGAVCGAADGMIWASDPQFKLSTYETDVHVDIDTTKKEQVNEQAILLDSKISLK